MLQLGTQYEMTFSVDPSLTAKAVGSGILDVLATPVMIARMEEAAWRAVSPQLDAGSSTVGTSMEVAHLSPTPVGLPVTCRAELTAMNGRSLTFHVTARDAHGLVGQGTHVRVIIQNEKFLAKAMQKLKPAES